MSELGKLLTCVTTGRRYADYPPISAVVDVSDSVSEVSYSTSLEYRLDVRIGASFIARSDEEKNYMIKGVRRRIIEHVFGEFREPLLELRQLLYERDIQKADQVLMKVLDQMFHEGL